MAKLQSYVLDILTGLEFTHSQGVIHSDMKIPNILRHKPEDDEAEPGEIPMVKICDFGLSHVMDPQYGDRKAMMVERCGTGGYIAPEI